MLLFLLRPPTQQRCQFLAFVLRIRQCLCTVLESFFLCVGAIPSSLSYFFAVVLSLPFSLSLARCCASSSSVSFLLLLFVRRRPVAMSRRPAQCFVHCCCHRYRHRPLSRLLVTPPNKGVVGARRIHGSSSYTGFGLPTRAKQA